MILRIYNTFTRQKEIFTPLTPGLVTMFVCGPTVYNLSHMGHAKTYTQFDVIARYLAKLGYTVNYLQNITDIDDKIIQRAAELGVQPAQLAAHYEREYLADMSVLGNNSVTVVARAHDYIDTIVAQIQRLIDRGNAYQLDDGWYFDLSTFPDYGALSGRINVRTGDSLARIDDHAGKRNTGDFALWKRNKPGEPYWNTPLGTGRPGWHIEDTAITETVFGPQYDIHGGAVDLIFPHHEAEIAQMEAASGRAPLARYWMHTGLLRIDGEKMSNSANNFTSIREALATTDAHTIRYALVSQHYRSSLDFTDTVLQQALGARRRVENFARSIDPNIVENTDHALLVTSFRQKFFDRLDDDFDTPGALAAVFDLIREYYRSNHIPGQAVHQFFAEVNDILGTFILNGHACADRDSAVESDLKRREELRQQRRFIEADVIRTDLLARGIHISDTATGTRWWKI